MDYLIGRPVWENVATYFDVDNWVYSPTQIHEMHRLLDLKEILSQRATDMHGNDN